MIEVKHLQKRFSLEGNAFHAVKDVSFFVEAGEIYGIIGLSGAGKSTLIRCLNRLEEADHGEIIIEGKNILSLNEKELNLLRRNIGMIFQSYNLFEQRNVYENIAFPLRLQGLDKKEIDQRVNELLAFVSLTEKKKAYPSTLSGGQKQRVAIARALATRPKILLCDEATSALDPNSTKQIIDLLKKTVKVYGTTIVLITHQMEVAKELCHRIAVMDSGVFVEENTVENLFKNPQSKLALEMIQSLNTEDDNEVFERASDQGKVYRLSYPQEKSSSPVLSECIKYADVTVNILAGNINRLSNTSVGHLYIELIGEEENKQKALSFLESKNVLVQEV